MNNIIKVGETINAKEYMTSKEIATITGKPHNDVLKAIRAMENAWVKVNGGNFSLVEYTDAKGEKRPMYKLNKTECLYIATKFNDEARAKLVIRWEELETKERQNVPALPQTYLEALKALVLSEEQKHVLALVPLIQLMLSMLLNMSAEAQARSDFPLSQVHPTG